MRLKNGKSIGNDAICNEMIKCLVHTKFIDVIRMLLGRRQANLCFHFAGSGENLPDITKSRDASLDNEELYSFT